MIKRRGGRRGQMRFDWNVLYTVGKIFSRAKRYCP
jgi:hypothetical protein